MDRSNVMRDKGALNGSECFLYAMDGRKNTVAVNQMVALVCVLYQSIRLEVLETCYENLLSNYSNMDTVISLFHLRKRVIIW